MPLFQKIGERLHSFFVPSEGNSFRPHSLRRDALMAVVVLVCATEGFLVTSMVLQSRAPIFSAAVLEGALVSLTNNARADAHLSPLAENSELTIAAQAKANDMAARGYFAHTGPEGKLAWDWMHEAGYDYAYAGENLAAHFYNSDEVVQAWLDSPTHRANVMRSNFSDIGIGIARGTYQGQDTIFVVQLFGTSKAELGIVPDIKVEASKPDVAANPIVVADTPAPLPVSPVVVEESPRPQVAGASTPQMPGSIMRLLSSPRTLAMWVLLFFTTLILISMVLAFIIRIHIQPADLLINGLVVAAFILMLVASNDIFFSGVDLHGLPAAVIEAR